MRILLTGGAGFIRSHVADQLLARGHEVAVVEDLPSGKRENAPEGAVFYERNIRDGHEALGFLSVTKTNMEKFCGVLNFSRGLYQRVGVTDVGVGRG
jgi:nucleoside-diphosphate-sugar epimerase